MTKAFNLKASYPWLLLKSWRQSFYQHLFNPCLRFSSCFFIMDNQVEISTRAHIATFHYYLVLFMASSLWQLSHQCLTSTLCFFYHFKLMTSPYQLQPCYCISFSCKLFSQETKSYKCIRTDGALIYYSLITYRYKYPYYQLTVGLMKSQGLSHMHIL